MVRANQGCETTRRASRDAGQENRQTRTRGGILDIFEVERNAERGGRRRERIKEGQRRNEGGIN